LAIMGGYKIIVYGVAIAAETLLLAIVNNRDPIRHEVEHHCIATNIPSSQTPQDKTLCYLKRRTKDSEDRPTDYASAANLDSPGNFQEE
jgi:hypothetical protein